MAGLITRRLYECLPLAVGDVSECTLVRAKNGEFSLAVVLGSPRLVLGKQVNYKRKKRYLPQREAFL
jgi:hypothetical protein